MKMLSHFKKNTFKKQINKRKRIFLLVFLGITLSLIVVVYKYINEPKAIDIFPDKDPIKIKPEDDFFIQESKKNDNSLYESLFGKDRNEVKANIIDDEENPIYVHKIKEKDVYELIEEKPAEEKQMEDKKLKRLKKNPIEIDESDSRSIKIRHKKPEYFYCELNYFLNKNEAELWYLRLKKMHKNIVEENHHNVDLKRIEDKLIYVVNVGKFDNFESAKSLCSKLIVRNQNCIIQKKSG